MAGYCLTVEKEMQCEGQAVGNALLSQPKASFSGKAEILY